MLQPHNQTIHLGRSFIAHRIWGEEIRLTAGAVARTDVSNSTEAGQFLGRELTRQLSGASADAVILFASSSYEAKPLLAALRETCHPAVLVGCTSAGEFTSHSRGEASACAIGLSSTEMRFAAGLGQGLRESRTAAASELVASFQGLHTSDFPYRTALILTDALAGYVEDFVEELTTLTAGTYQFFGGGAGDDAKFQKTSVFLDSEVFEDSAVGLEILSRKPIGIGFRHGWQAATGLMRVTESEGMRVKSLNATVASEVFSRHAAETSQTFDPAHPLPFFLHNVLGIRGAGEYRLRVPLAVEEDGSVTCAADIPVGSTASVMETTAASAVRAASEATFDAVSQLNGHEPAVALFFDCVATRLRIGKDFGVELESVQDALRGANFAGFNSYGQIARTEGQYSGFHNCTAVVCVLPA